MMTDSDLESEVTAKMEERIAAGQPVRSVWLTKEVVDAHSDLDALGVPDADFYRLCAYKAVRAAVREVVRRERNQSEDDASEQTAFPGYERLQRRYVVEREGEQEIVPLQDLTDREGRAKVELLRSMSRGNAIHADELERYLDERFRVAAEE